MARILIGNIKGPKGDTGPQGEQGPVGPQGPQGPLPPLVNNALSTEAGVAALDAVMGKTLQDQITQVNSEMNDRLPHGSNYTGIKAPAQSDGSYYQAQLLSDGRFRIAKNTGGSFGNWNDFLTNADIAAISYNDTPSDTIEDLIKSKAEIIAQNTNSNIAGLLPGGWNGREFGFTIFSRAYDTINLAFVGNYDFYVAAYSISTDTLDQLKKVTLTDV